MNLRGLTVELYNFGSSDKVTSRFCTVSRCVVFVTFATVLRRYKLEFSSLSSFAGATAIQITMRVCRYESFFVKFLSKQVKCAPFCR